MTDRKEQTGQIRISGSSFKPAPTGAGKRAGARGGKLRPETVALLESFPLGVHVYKIREDGQLAVVWANSAADRILGVDNRVYFGSTITETFPQLHGTGVPEKYIEVAKTGKAWFADQVFMRGRKVDGAYDVFAFQADPGVVVVTFRDITRRKESQFKDEEQRKKLEKQVQLRTLDLRKTNEQLKNVLAERGKAEMAVRQRLAMERLVTQLAIRFINVPLEDMGHDIENALGEIGEFAKADRVYIMKIYEGTEKAFVLHQWTFPGDVPFQGDLMELDFSHLPMWRNLVRRNGVIHVPEVKELDEASLEKNILTARGTRSVLAVPLQFGGKTLGLLGLESTRRKVNWTREDSTIMTAIGTVLVNALERAKAEVMLQEKARQDPLTGLYNHRYILEQLAECLGAAHQEGHILTVALCDFDDFKGINDRHGHRTGDEVLIEFSRIIKDEMRETDLAGRCGGDEFLLLFPNTADVQTRGIMDRILTSLREKEFVDAAGNVFTTSFSYGLACSRPDLREPEELFSVADEALYGAKSRKNGS